MRNEGRERFHDLLRRFSHGMLVTRTPDADLRARPLAVAAIEEDDDLWFVTSHRRGDPSPVPQR